MTGPALSLILQRTHDGMDVLERLQEARRRGEPVALCVVVQVRGSTPRAAGAKMLVFPDGRVSGSIGGGELERQVVQDALGCLRSRQPFSRRHDLLHQHNMCCGGSVDIYIEPVMPKERLYIFGAGHTGHALARHAVSLDFEVFVIDDRKEYLDQIQVPEVNKLHADFQSVLPSLPFNEHTYIAIMTYSHPIDRDLLAYCVRQPYAYLGMIGSERKVEMTKKLFAEGKIASEEALKQVDMPMGLPIGAETPDEIAVSVLAKLVAVRRVNSKQ
jgi:xanthine dehydrogenase accessory factor